MRADLAQRIENGCVVLTPNRRLAAHLEREFNLAQIAARRTVWPSPEIVSYSTWLERAYAGLARLDAGDSLLSEAQELALWERVVCASPQAEALLGPAAVARAAREAWRVQHAFRIDLVRCAPALDEDATAYTAWAARFRQICRERRWLDAAALPDAIAAALASKPLARRGEIVLYAFGELSPQQRAVFDALHRSGWRVSELEPEARAGRAARTAYADAETELTAVASAARETLDADPAARVGVIVPDLARRRADLVRIFDDVLDPARVVSGSRGRARPFNVSLGRPLADYPLVHCALLVLALARNDLPLGDTGSLLRSPFIAAAEQELVRRALLDAVLRERGRPSVTLGALRAAARGRNASDPCASPLLAGRLEQWTPLARSATRLRQPPSAWSATFLQLLSALGWPGERALDSAEYQTLEKWRDAVAALSQLDLLAPRVGYDEALAALKRLAADTPYQPESPEVPVQVLGVLEATGLEFGALFVTGLTDEAWPEPPRPDPFLPLALQRAAGVPHASAEWNLAFARRTTAAWLGAAAIVRLSHPLRDGDRELSASRLLRGVAEDEPTGRAAPFFRETVFAARAVETLADFTAPALPPGVEARGGADLFKNQAACPFRAFAIHRLGAAALEAARVGLDARDRGGLVHLAAFDLWRELKSHACLLAANDAELAAAVDRAVARAVESARKKRPDVMTDAFAALERERVSGLLLRLLALEKRRAPFEVLAREAPRPISVAGVKVSTRLDRIDRLGDGAHVILDYKTGRDVDVAQWLGERPDEPQLPLYAASGRGDPAAVAFVQLHAQGVRFEGLSRAASVLPDVRAFAGSKAADGYADWSDLLVSWRAVLENLAREFLAGRAEVAPKDYPATCRHCDLGMLCRVQEIRERGSVAPGENGDE